MNRFLVSCLAVMLAVTGTLRAATLTSATPSAIQTGISEGYQYQVTVAGTFGGATVALEIYNHTLQDYVAVTSWTATANETIRATGQKLRFTATGATGTTSLAVEALRLPLSTGTGGGGGDSVPLSSLSTTGGANKVPQADANGNLYLAPLVPGTTTENPPGNNGNLVLRDARTITWAQSDGAGNSIIGAGLTLFEMNFLNGHPGGGIMQLKSKGNIGMNWFGGLQLGWADGSGDTFILTPSGVATAIDTKRESNPFVMPVNYWNGSAAIENRMGFQAVPVDTSGTVGFRFYKGVTENGVQDLSTRGTTIATLTEYGLDSAGTAPAFVTLDATTPVQTCVPGRTFQAAKLTLAGNRTLSITGAVAGMRGVIHVTRPTGGGAYTLTKPTSAVLRTGATESSTGDTTDKWMWEYDGTYLTIDIVAGFPVVYNAGDTDAAAYIAAVETAKGSVATNVQRAAIDAFIIAEKAASRWTLHQRLYLPIWSNAAANAIDMKTLATGTFANSPTHSAGFVDFNGSTQYFDFGVAPGSLGMSNASAVLFALVKSPSTIGLSALVSSFSGSNYMTLSCQNPGYTQSHICNIATSGYERNPEVAIFLAARGPTTIQLARRDGGAHNVYDNATVTPIGTVPSANFIVGARDTGMTWPNDGQFGAYGVSQYFSTTSDFTGNLETMWETCTGQTLPDNP